MKNFPNSDFCTVIVALLSIGIPTVSVADTQTIGFDEIFVLSENRAEALKQLIPGTEDYYYYHALHFQNEGELGMVDALLKPWIKRHQRSPRVREIQHRQALLGFDDNAVGSLEYLRNELGLKFDHAKEELNNAPKFPTELDQKVITRESFLKEALRRHKNLAGLEDAALDWLLRDEVALDPVRRRHLLQRLKLPDFRNLVSVIATDLETKESRGFGEFEIHRQLTRMQLDELVKQVPGLIQQAKFVNVYLSKLRPGEDVDWANDDEEKGAYLGRMWAFVKDLDPVFNSLKAHVLYHVLDHQRSGGQYDRRLFMAYIALPRSVDYIEPNYLEGQDRRRFTADLQADFRAVTSQDAIGSDSALVRDFLSQYFVVDEDFSAYSKFLRDSWLEPLFAEVKIVHGIGDQERWYSMILPAQIKALKDRIDIEFAMSNPKRYAPEDAVSLDLFVKNVDQLLVKVYEVNALNFYSLNGREVDTHIVLDGLVANSEQVHEFDETDLRRVRRTFEFPELKGRRGVWVIEFIGNGRSSRALVRKGKLQFLARPSAAGSALQVFDESNRLVESASVWLGGREYMADKAGEVTVPFTNQPGRVPVILVAGGFASLDHFEHRAESYQFTAGFHLERETLLPNQQAEVVIRPALSLDGQPLNLGLLKNVRLVIESTDLDGISSSAQAPDFELALDRESLFKFNVPERLASIKFTLIAQVENLSAGRTDTLLKSQVFHLNGIDSSEHTVQFHLAKIDGKYVIEVLGKSGEIYAGRVINLQFKHYGFNDPAHTTLQTDSRGHVHLGALEDIDWVRAEAPGKKHTWRLLGDWHSRDTSVHGVAGKVVLVPYSGVAAKVGRGDFALFETRGGTFVADVFDKLSLDRGFLEVGPLPAGNYRLFMKESGVAVNIRLAAGERVGRFVLAEHRHLELRNTRPLQIESVDVGEEAIRIQLANVSRMARVHVSATRYLPEFAIRDGIGAFPHRNPNEFSRAHSTSRYLSGRDIGDELRYILDRRQGKVFPGNMLHRPSNLLNPWAIRDTDTDIVDARAGEDYRRTADDKARSVGEAEGFGDSYSNFNSGTEGHGFTSLDFLAVRAPAIYNLVPDEDGIVTIETKNLGDRQHLHVFAVDPANSAYRQVSVECGGTAVLPTSLKNGLDPEKHYAEQRNISLLDKGDELEIGDLSTAEFETYDDLDDIFTLYTTLSKNRALSEFRFILDWPGLKDGEKRANYSKFACHELNFFLSRRDPKFFAAVVKPNLANKKDKTFLDHYLTGADLKAYLEPWNYSRLNTVERVLLAGRIGGDEPAATARHLSDQLELVPQTPIAFEVRFFETALATRSLQVDWSGVMDGGHKLITPSPPRTLYLQSKQAPSAAPPAPRRSPAEGLEEKSESMGRKQQSKKRGSRVSLGEVNLSGGDFGIEALGEIRDKQAAARQFYRKLEATKEWAENNYYHLPIAKQNGDLVKVGAFWVDYAQHLSGERAEEPFLSKHFIGAQRSFTEMMFAMSVIGIPYQSGEHAADVVDGKLSVKAASPAIIVHREISEAEISDDKTPLLISQNYFLHHDRYEQKNGEKTDKLVDGEFLAGAVYGCQVVATNPSSGKQKLELLVQVPRGAVPVLKSRKTKSQRLELEPYRTQTFEYSFYFPKPSEQGAKNSDFPAHLARDEAIAAWADVREFDVVAEFSTTDTAGWDYISQHGTQAEVIGRLQAGNTSSLQLDRIAWRMKDVEFFRETLALLHTRHTYDHTLYSYGIYHAEVPVARQFLMHSNSFLGQCGASIVSTLVTVDPVERGNYQHLEYSPLVNARAHRLGRERKIVNPQFHSQYHQFLRVLRYIPQPDDEDRLDLAYYLLLQDRIAAGLGQLAKVDVKRLPGKIQHDYFLCHAAFSREDPSEARRIATKYRDYPVDRWRERFGEVLAQVDQILGNPVAIEPADNTATEEHPDDGSERAKAQDQLADTEPSISVKVEAGEVTVHHQNLSRATVNYYEMDLEFLFSSNPFVGSGGAGRFSIIKPNLSAALELGGKGGEKKFMLPEAFRASNVLVEVVAAGQKAAQPYFAHTLDVTVVENYGRLEVRDSKTREPLSKTYIKVYARDQGGAVKFYKDGYTDLRGKFDYASLNTSQLGTAQRFAILVMSEKNGSLVKEVATPFRGNPAAVDPTVGLSSQPEITPKVDPIPEPASPVVDDMRRYIVHSGDSVSKIAKQFAVTPEEIHAVNRIDALYELYQGRVLRIPASTRSQSLPPYAEAVPGKYGLVYSPFVTDKKKAMVNVTDENNVPLPPGTEVQDPLTGKVFRVP